MRTCLDFLGLDRAQSKQKSEPVSSESVCALDGHLTPIRPAVPLCAVWHLSMAALFQAYSNFSLEWSKHSQRLAVACMLALLLNCPQSGQKTASRLVPSAFGSYWQRQR